MRYVIWMLSLLLTACASAGNDQWRRTECESRCVNKKCAAFVVCGSGTCKCEVHSW